MAKEARTNVMRLLEAAGIAASDHFYEASDGLIDGVSVANKVGMPVEQVFKTLVTQSPAGEHFVFMVPVAEELDLKKAARAAGVKSIAMIPSKDLLKTTGYIHGGCSPVGMKKPFPTFLDESAVLQETIFFSGGRIGAQVQCAPDDLLGYVHGSYADLTK